MSLSQSNNLIPRPQPGQDDSNPLGQSNPVTELDSARLREGIEQARTGAGNSPISPGSSLTPASPEMRQGALASLLSAGASPSGNSPSSDQLEARKQVNSIKSSTSEFLGLDTQGHIELASLESRAVGDRSANKQVQMASWPSFPSSTNSGLIVSALGRMLLDQIPLLQGQQSEFNERPVVTQSARMSLTRLSDGISNLIQRYFPRASSDNQMAGQMGGQMGGMGSGTSSATSS